MQKSLKWMLSVLWGISILHANENEIDPVIYHNKYGNYFVPKNHERPAVLAVKKGQVYEEETLSYIASIYQAGTDIVHAGTYFGDMLSFFSSLVGPNHVWGFEPVRLSFLCAQKNIQLNHLENVFLFHFALSDHSGQSFMKTKESGIPLGGSSRIIEKKPSIEEGELVEIRPLDVLLKGKSARIGILHLDVEGHELFALRGARQMIAQDQPVIILECWESEARKIAKYMDQIGYHFVKKIDGNVVYYPN